MTQSVCGLLRLAAFTHVMPSRVLHGGVCLPTVFLLLLRLLPGSVNASCELFTISWLIKKTESRLQNDRKDLENRRWETDFFIFQRRGYLPCSLKGDASRNRGVRILFKAIKRSNGNRTTLCYVEAEMERASRGGRKALSFKNKGIKSLGPS